jgi:hypothetical protein
LIWVAIAIVLGAGAVGGVINALLSNNGFPLPKPLTTPDGEKIWLPGILGNLILGSVGAVVAWGLYGPVSTYVILNSAGQTATQGVILTLSALVGGVLVGAAGARWWSSEVDKKLLHSAAGTAVAANAAPDQVARIMTASPQAAFDIASKLRSSKS